MQGINERPSNPQVQTLTNSKCTIPFAQTALAISVRVDGTHWIGGERRGWLGKRNLRLARGEWHGELHPVIVAIAHPKGNGFSYMLHPLLPKSSQNPPCPLDAHTSSIFFVFLQFAIFVRKTATLISKNVIFIYLIFNWLNWFCSWFLQNNFVCLPTEIINVFIIKIKPIWQTL